MAMTYNDAVKMVKDMSHRGDVDVTTDTNTAKILRAMTEIRRQIIRQLPKEWLKTSETISMTVAGGTTYALSATCQESNMFRYTDDGSEYMIKKVASEKEFFEKYYDPNSAADRPAYYCEIGPSAKVKQIRIEPAPDATYTVTHSYWKDPSGTKITTSDLSTTVDDIPDYTFDCLWKGTLYLFLKSYDDEGWKAAKQDYIESLIEADIADDRDLDGDVGFRFDAGDGYLHSEAGLRID